MRRARWIVSAVVAAGKQRGGSVIVYETPDLYLTGCAVGEPVRPASRAAIAVVYVGEHLVFQTRNPSALRVSLGGGRWREIALGGDDVFDTGHSIFHTSTAAQIACASCHPEGGEDGHTWRFEGLGHRRTPALHSVAGSAPFHWQGELADMSELAEEVFNNRMSGGSLSPERTAALESWIGHIRPPRWAPNRTRSEAVARGRALFEGAADCARCHSGPHLTDGRSADVGTGGDISDTIPDRRLRSSPRHA